jgi:hypothetical protein
MAAGTLVQGIDWTRLRHARGVAADIPALLSRLRTQRGIKFDDTLGALCSRIWHNGTIFSASGPATRELIALLEITPNPERTYLYEVLAALAESAREAVLSTPETPCAAGTFDDGLAVLRNIHADRERFRKGMSDKSPLSRRLSARLLVACDDADSAAEVLELFAAATDRKVRSELLAGLLRMAEDIPDWPRFIESTLKAEKDPESRFLLRSSEIAAARNEASEECVADLVHMFLEANENTERSFTDTCGDPDQFVQTLSLLSEERGTDALCQALKGAKDDNLALLVAERLVRLAFHDERTNWGDAHLRMVKLDGSEIQPDHPIVIILRSLTRIVLRTILPFLRNRWPLERTQETAPCVEYVDLEGPVPPLPERPTESQAMAVKAMAECPNVWRIHTNLWDLFDLPATRAGMQELADSVKFEAT